MVKTVLNGLHKLYHKFNLTAFRAPFYGLALRFCTEVWQWAGSCWGSVRQGGSHVRGLANI